MHKEVNFEAELEQALLAEGGYAKGSPDDYDPELALFPKEILAFIQTTQPGPWARLVSLNGDEGRRCAAGLPGQGAAQQGDADYPAQRL